MQVTDGEKERRILSRSDELLKQWVSDLTDEMLEESEDVVDGVVVPAYMTACYDLYNRLKEFVEAKGGIVATFEFDGDPD